MGTGDTTPAFYSQQTQFTKDVSEVTYLLLCVDIAFRTDLDDCDLTLCASIRTTLLNEVFRFTSLAISSREPSASYVDLNLTQQTLIKRWTSFFSKPVPPRLLPKIRNRGCEAKTIYRNHVNAIIGAGYGSSNSLFSPRKSSSVEALELLQTATPLSIEIGTSVRYWKGPVYKVVDDRFRFRRLRDSIQRSSLDLYGLLVEYREANATDPWGKVYALMGLTYDR